jgi:chromosome partitioning protein
VQTIVFAATKGGVGKTTLTQNIAGHAARFTGVLLADLDPQQSLATWWHLRGGRPDPMLVTGVGQIGHAIRMLTEKGRARDYFIIDTPGSLIPLIRDAIAAADCIVVPTQASPLDIMALGAIEDLIDSAGKRSKSLYVVNRAAARSSLVAEAVEAVSRKSPNPPGRIAQRDAYARAALNGRTGGEINTDAAIEIDVLWRSICKVLER